MKITINESKPIAGFEEWIISKNGQVFHAKTGEEYNYKVRMDGYLLFYYYPSRGPDNRITEGMHRVVWRAFKGDIPKGWVIDHIDGNKKNNRLENLRCITRSENSKLCRQANRHSAFGWNHRPCKKRGTLVEK